MWLHLFLFFNLSFIFSLFCLIDCLYVRRNFTLFLVNMLLCRCFFLLLLFYLLIFVFFNINRMAFYVLFLVMFLFFCSLFMFWRLFMLLFLWFLMIFFLNLMHLVRTHHFLPFDFYIFLCHFCRYYLFFRLFFAFSGIFHRLWVHLTWDLFFCILELDIGAITRYS